MGMNGSTPEINLNTFPQLNEKIPLHLPAIAELKVTILWSISLQGKEKAADLTLKDLDPSFFQMWKPCSITRYKSAQETGLLSFPFSDPNEKCRMKYKAI